MGGDDTSASTEGVDGLAGVNDWPVDRAAAGWTAHDGSGATVGDPDDVFPLASITKALFSLAVLIAVEEGSLDLDQPAGPDGATIAHLLSHSSGLAPEARPDDPEPVLADVGTRRIYSNLGFDLLGRELEAATGFTPARYLHEAVVEPLGLQQTELRGSPAKDAVSSVADLLIVAHELMRPTLIAAQTVRLATSPHLPDLPGVLPGYGRQDPNPWGLGFEIRGAKHPHWTSPDNSRSTFGHFGASGTFLWVDPDRALACAALTDRDFDQWAIEAWPPLSTAVIGAFEQ